MKTIYQWLNELPEPYNQMAIASATEQLRRPLEIHVNSMSDAINVSISWSDTDEGQDFWHSIYNYYEEQERIPGIESQMTEAMLRYYTRIERIRNTPFPNAIQERADRLERERIEREEQMEEERLREVEKQRQIDEAVTYSSSFNNMLMKIKDSSTIAQCLLMPEYLTNKEADYVTMRRDMCSFLPAGREHKVNEETGRWLRDGRQEMKPAKMARKLIVPSRIDEFSESDFEKFTNAVKSYISIVGDDDGEGKSIRFELVSGDDIRKYYSWRTYSELMGKETNLWGSCMRSDDCQDYFRIYTDNPEVCSLLVAFDKDDKVLGRALVWTFDDGKRGMDTIYAHESLIESFVEWAISNEALYKDRQSCHHQQFDRLNRRNVVYCAAVKLNKYKSICEYPYMDTLSILNHDGYLYTDSEDLCDYKILRDTGGGYEDSDGDEYVILENGRRCHRDNCYYLDYRNYNGERVDGYYHENDVCWNNGGDARLKCDCVRIGGDWYDLDDDDIKYVEDRGEYYLADDTAYCLYDDTTYHIDDCHELADGTYAHMDDCNVCEHSGDYYLLDDLTRASNGACVANENLDEYEELIKEQLKQDENETATA